ncbi:MAG: GntR family transcriptional regulator [Lachnospiraceae bacterium]
MENYRGPLYYRVKETIKEGIHSGVMKPGDVIPTEEKLIEAFGVSRVTIRRVISELVDEGVLEKDFSKTPRVKKDYLHRNLNTFTGLTDEFSRRGLKMSSYIHRTDIIQADKSLADRFGVDKGTELLFVERVRYANSDPLLLNNLYFINELIPGFDPYRLVSESFYNILEKEYSLKIAKSNQTITSVLSSNKQTALLELTEKTALLHVESLGYLENGEVAEFSDNYYIGSRYSIEFTAFKN